ncbi:hypothetical protein [Spongorhabdus nitratireducens]
MITLKKLFAVALLSAASLSAQAGSPTLYVDTSAFSDVNARVYQDGMPVAGARVTVSSNGGMFMKEMTTDANGLAHFNSVQGIVGVTVTAVTDSGSDIERVVLRPGHEK